MLQSVLERGTGKVNVSRDLVNVVVPLRNVMLVHVGDSSPSTDMNKRHAS